MPNERAVQNIANWILTPISPAAALFLNGSETWWIFAVLGGGLGVLVATAHIIAPALRDYIISFCFVGQCILFTSSLTGHAWQLDSHMLFFAVLAIVSTLNNAKALVFATVLVALHHVSLSYLLPKLVFPGASMSDNIERAALHAVIVLLETGVLLLSLSKRAIAEKALQDERVISQSQTQVARDAEEAANQSRESAHYVTDILERHLTELANGRLNNEITEDFPPEFTQLRQSYNDTVRKLGQTIRDVSRTATRISASIHDMSTSSNDLSKRTETQAATLEETAAAMDVIATSVEQAADSAKDASRNTDKVKQEILTNVEIVKGAMAAMESIQTSSAKIATIIDVIDDISFQTNLLALNAGVEAARAGQAGDGFAVVANEVRVLAHLSAEAATEIKTFIDDSAQQVTKGAEFVRKTDASIDIIVKKFTDINGSISQIADRSQDQSLGLGEVNSSVRDLDTVTQKNAAMVDELSHLGTSLGSDVRKLLDLMQSFDVADNLPEERRNAA